MRQLRWIFGAVIALVVATGCAPPDPGPRGLYRGVQPDIDPVVTPEDQAITWGSAPNIDASYGGTLYAGTAAAIQDPRPALTAAGEQPLRVWIADPDDGRRGRPAILWFHGGGFAAGIDSMHAMATNIGQEYAQRGYVGLSFEYRIDSTLIGTGTATRRPPSLCQWVQDNADPASPLWLDRKAQCERNIRAAVADALAAVRWVRRHAADLGVDPQRIAVAGFSAGAVIADFVAYEPEDVGPEPYFAGDDLSVDASRVQAAFGGSGCLYNPDFGAPPTTPGPGDAPTSFIHAEIDRAVPYECQAQTVTAARAQGLTAELTSYCDQEGHGSDLYRANQDVIDEQWTVFLTRELRIYTQPRPTADPLC